METGCAKFKLQEYAALSSTWRQTADTINIYVRFFLVMMISGIAAIGTAITLLSTQSSMDFFEFWRLPVVILLVIMGVVGTLLSLFIRCLYVREAVLVDRLNGISRYFAELGAGEIGTANGKDFPTKTVNPPADPQVTATETPELLMLLLTLAVVNASYLVAAVWLYSMDVCRFTIDAGLCPVNFLTPSHYILVAVVLMLGQLILFNRIGVACARKMAAPTLGDDDRCP